LESGLLYDYSFYPECLARYYFQYYAAGDTLIESNIHKKIYCPYVIFDSISCATSTYYFVPPSKGYVGALRDDSINNRAFFVLPNTTNDSLLYDYNLNVGDTMKGYITQYPYGISHLVVLSVDSVLINGQYRKRWNFAPDSNPQHDSTYIIEGIRSSSGLIEPLNTYAVDLTLRYLVCITDSKGTLFTSGYNSAYGCNLITVGIKEISNENDLISIFPNPAISEIQVIGNQSTVISIDIYNMLGEMVFPARITDNRSPITINVSALPSGMYFLEIKSEKGVTVKKFIKERE
jgi:hypothetical protein